MQINPIVFCSNNILYTPISVESDSAIREQPHQLDYSSPPALTTYKYEDM